MERVVNMWGFVLSALGPIRILIADDHSVVRERLHRVLHWQSDFEIVGEAKTGVEAVSLA